MSCHRPAPVASVVIRTFAVLGCLVSLTCSATGDWHEPFDEGALHQAWTVSTVLSQGAGAAPGYNVAGDRLLWSYESGSGHAQQQVLLRSDVRPAVGQAVEVRLFPEDYPQGQQDFAGLALSESGATVENRAGLLLFFVEPAAGQLRCWHFGAETDRPSVSHSATPDLAAARTLILRLVRIGERHMRASWSTDGEQFHWLPAVRCGPVQAIGLYNGNSRNPRGNRLAFDDFRVLPCVSPDRPEDYAATTPSWTMPEAFLAAEGVGGDAGWPAVEPEFRPGAYWWWPGSAVSKEDLTWNLETYRRAGWGNLGVIGIYGVRGEEERFLEIFSPRWFEMFNHAVAEARRLGMNLDLTPSSGWRMGGPHVTPEFGEQNVAVQEGRIAARPNNARVKRAGPGGEGLTINPFSQAAVAWHLDWLDQRFAAGDGVAPRAFYYDSFENPGNWCPEFLAAFRARRGYPLEEHAAALAGEGDPDYVRRVVCDYRETLSELLLGCVAQIVDWGQQRGSGLRMQAHGAPAQLLDMYAAASIPETEVFGASHFEIPGFRRDPDLVPADQQSDLVNRCASSAAHVSGRPVVISESFTWLRNHYHTALSHIKAESDKLLLNGINCIYYHGICYAPQQTVWPGWLFYASTQANARNSIFRDVPLLNAYLTRCQSVLQQGAPHNDVLLYWPVYDLWMRGGQGELRFSVHHPEWLEASPCGAAGRWMMERGYTFDFVSDAQLRETQSDGAALRTGGGSAYRAILVPAARCMPLETARQLLALAEAGATVLVWNELPQDVPGWQEHAARKQQLAGLWPAGAETSPGVRAVGRGQLAISDDLPTLFELAGIARERLVDHGLQFIRRKTAEHVSYFIANHSARPHDGWTALASPCQAALLMDPMTARTGRAPLRQVGGRAEVYLQLQPGETRVLRAFAENRTLDAPAWRIAQPSGEGLTVTGTWQVEFREGGPVLPPPFATEELQCWTGLGGAEAARFAGAARYTIGVEVPESDADGWFLDLGDVRESARVWVNGRPAGAVVAHPFRVDVTGLLQAGRNELAIEVTNLSANRIRDLDQRGVDWKKFYDINIVSHLYRPFDASAWPAKPSGLLGPVTLNPTKMQSFP